MTRSLLALVATLATGLWLAGTTAALADDVSVKVIDPDKQPPAAQPKSADQAKPGESAKPGETAAQPKGLRSGDRRTDQLLEGLNLTADQQAKVAPLVEPILKQLKAASEETDSQTRDLLRQMGQGGDAARAAREKLGQIFDQSRKTTDGLRQQLVEKLDPVLTNEQKAKLKDLQSGGGGRGFFAGGGGPGLGAQGLVSLALAGAGLKLTDEQQKKIAEKLQPLIQQQMDQGRQIFEKMNALRDRTRKEGGDPEAQKELDELTAKSREQLQASLKAATDAIAEALTPEQKAKFDEARKKMSQDRDRFMTDGAVRRAERVGLTDEQKQKVSDLAKAAQDALGKLAPDDQAARDQLGQQLDKDIKALLTEEQQKKYDEGGRGPGRGGFGRRGGPGGNGGRNRGGSGAQPADPGPATTN